MKPSTLWTTPSPTTVIVSVSRSSANDASTEVTAFIATVQGPEPAQAPVQPVKCDPVTGTGVSVTDVPQSKSFVHDVLPHVRPAGLDVTLPWPDPLSET